MSHKNRPIEDTDLLVDPRDRARLLEKEPYDPLPVLFVFGENIRVEPLERLPRGPARQQILAAGRPVSDPHLGYGWQPDRVGKLDEQCVSPPGNGGRES